MTLTAAKPQCLAEQANGPSPMRGCACQVVWRTKARHRQGLQRNGDCCSHFSHVLSLDAGQRAAAAIRAEPKEQT